MSSGQQGVLQSPNFPNNYPTNMNVQWTFVAENHSNIIQINFTHIILEEDYDTLTVCLKDVCSEEEMLVLTGIYGVIVIVWESLSVILLCVHVPLYENKPTKCFDHSLRSS